MLGGLLGLVATLMVGMAAEVIAMRRLYGCDHLDHVLGTSGVDPVFDGAVRLIWGPEGLSLPLPSWLNTSLQILLRLPARHHHRLADGRRLSLFSGNAHAHRHADPRRCLQPQALASLLGLVVVLPLKSGPT